MAYGENLGGEVPLPLGPFEGVSLLQQAVTLDQGYHGIWHVYAVIPDVMDPNKLIPHGYVSTRTIYPFTQDSRGRISQTVVERIGVEGHVGEDLIRRDLIIPKTTSTKIRTRIAEVKSARQVRKHYEGLSLPILKTKS